MTSPSWLAVSGDFGGKVLDAAGAAALTQDVTIQRVTASPLTLGGQEQTTLLTHVAVDVEAAVQRHYPDGLLLSRFGHDGLATH